MKRKLALLNLALVAVLVWIGFRFRAVNTAARERESAVLAKRIPRQTYPPLPAPPTVQPLVAGNYLNLATRMLLAKDRNPNVIIDPEPVQEKPKMPPLPVAHGLMLFGDPGIIMSERPGAVQRTYRKGEKIGAFKLLAFDNKHVVFDWNGEKVDRTLDELLEKTPSPIQDPAASASAANAPVASVASQQTSNAQPLGPGADVGGGIRACQANDSLPAGAVQGGYRKVEVATPFGRSCRWEPVR